MNTERRDQAVERMLRHPDVASNAPGSCLDAETLAAWVDGGLNESQLAMAETHVSDCSRCQAMAAALVRTPPAMPTPEPRWRRSWGMGWLVPLTAGAAAVALWLALPNSDRAVRQPASTEARADVSTPGEVQTQEPAAAKAGEPALTDRAQAPAAVGDGRRAPAETAQKSANEAAKAERTTAQDAAGGLAAPAPAAPPPAARAAESAAAPTRTVERFRQARAEIASPNPSIRWRIGEGGSVYHSSNGGSTWEAQPTGVAAELTTGASPSATVCWLVGRAGTVLLTTDGRRFQRVTFPEAVDLVAVQAADARTATVTAADGRTFQTTDGGVTWTRSGQP